MQAGIAVRMRIGAGKVQTAYLLVSCYKTQQASYDYVSPWTHSWNWRDYNNGSRREGIDCKALFKADVSFPPASARSGLPPPEPPTCLANCWISLPACTLEVRSFVTPAIRATLPSSDIPRATTPEPSFWRKESTSWRRPSRSTLATSAAITLTPLTNCTREV